MRKITVSDYTLRELCKSGQTPLLFREKTAIAATLDSFGADVIELPAISRAREDSIIFRTIAAQIRNSVLCIPVGMDVAGVQAAWDCVKDAARPRLQVMLPVSTVTMEYSCHMKEDKMLGKIRELCQAAKAFCPDVEYSAMDATRADPAFLEKAVLAAQEAGATVISYSDDAGLSLPREIAAITAGLKAVCSLPLLVSVSDQLGMGNAAAFAALDAGADGVKTAVAGEQVLNTARFAEALAIRGESLGLTSVLKRTELKTDVNVLLKQLNRPADGGIAAESEILLDAASTLEQVSAATQQLGYTLSAEDVGLVHRSLLTVCQRKGSVGRKELEAIIASSAMQAPSVYHLSSFSCTSSNLVSSMASVTLVKNGDDLNGVALGDGPIDAAFRAVEQCVGFHYELDDFQIQAVTEGKEALGSALVRLRSGGRLYSGNGLSTDIVGASIRAYVNALNKIVAEEEQA